MLFSFSKDKFWLQVIILTCYLILIFAYLIHLNLSFMLMLVFWLQNNWKLTTKCRWSNLILFFLALFSEPKLIINTHLVLPFYFLRWSRMVFHGTLLRLMLVRLRIVIAFYGFRYIICDIKSFHLLSWKFYHYLSRPIRVVQTWGLPSFVRNNTFDLHQWFYFRLSDC